MSYANSRIKHLVCIILAFVIFPTCLVTGTLSGQDSNNSIVVLEEDLSGNEKGKINKGEQAFLTAVLLFGNNEFAEALESLDKSINLGYMHSDTFLLVGICHLHLNSVVKAKENFELYINQDGGTENLNVVGKVCYAFGLFDDALAYFKTAVRRDPDDSAIYSNMGSIMLEKMMLVEARICFTKAIELNPTLTEAHLNLGILNFMTEDFEAAEKSFIKTIKLWMIA